MDASAWGLLALYLVLLAAAAWPLGLWMHRLLDGRHPLWMQRLEAPLLRLAGGRGEQDWRAYALALLAFNALGVLALYALQRLQHLLPLNPAGITAPTPDSALNTAISFVTNTNWQGYAGEAGMSLLTQMAGLAVQNFVSAATGIAVAFALVRGFARRSSATLGNFWEDLLRSTLWLLLPLSLLLALALVQQGVVQNLSGPLQATLVEELAYSQPRLDAAGQPLRDAAGQALTETVRTGSQTLPMGPVASQEAIKMLGTNGGGFFNANSAHPYENPTALSNLLQMLAIFAIPAGLCVVFGRAVGDLRQGAVLLAAMTVMFVVAVVVATGAEQAGNPQFAALGADGTANMEGKEQRFGIATSTLFAVITTSASCGAVNAMHDSFTPLGGMVPMVMMQLGEVVFGGVGAGLYGMLVFAVVAVFIAGLMIGRTPEYVGKKIGPHEMKLVALVVLATPLLVLLGTAVAAVTPAGLAGLANPGAHGFSEILYAFSSAANNNGSAFAGLSANTPFYNLMLGGAMWGGRFLVIVPVLALAGALAARPRLPATAGTLPTHGPLFAALLVGTVLLVGLLNYVPALALGPVVEHLLLWAGN